MTEHDDDDRMARLFALTGDDAPPPDAAFLAKLREDSLQTFLTSTVTPSSLREKSMLSASFRWLAAVAAVLVVGVVLAQWFARTPRVEPVAEVPFAVEDKLVEDGRIGKISDAQGVVSVRPALAERFSPASAHLVLMPGDLVRTDRRGANAAAVTLANSSKLIIGPHSTVLLGTATEIQLQAGEVEIASATPLQLKGPDGQAVKVEGKQHYRVDKDRLVRVEKEPLWLKGFKGSTTNESIGSLIATVDGRNEPLTVGFHRVTVDIRDQIARTVVEESFVNRTGGVLEGVFHFPLPADASISGFGMWVGDQLIEADVVEKQRAREIYETILREKRDPGLLEWAGGNIFKARVYPIPAHGEKRIRISYTQVLPLVGTTYRYGYALQSDLLKLHPLSELSVSVTVSSAVPVKAVTCPTHPARITKTDASAKVEFAAQEYTPTRDFEAVVEVGTRPSDVVMIPHRRGDDGYFLMQLTPPGGGVWQRPLLPNGDPFKLLLLADTSASMDKAQRAKQAAVIVSLLNALTPKDTVNLALCDVNCDWVFETPRSATPETVTALRTALEKRASLGWTNLDQALQSALKMSDSGTHAVYVGDGIVTTGDADAVTFAQRLKRASDGKSGTFHAITVGSSYEPAALKAIAAVGGGSVRRVAGERSPQAIALELLGEISAPALKDLKVSFTGLRTARVYPEELPNIPAGTQQILLGRYLPEGRDQTGEIVVTGTLGGKPVRYTTKVTLVDAEQGNSFIPRLWARQHLDTLLEQGASPTIQQQVIALSEEFNIITPYTSLLVLETDADRERFGVKTRYRMRDGERFFAAGADAASLDLKQRQMQSAAAYRTELRRRVLSQMAGLGRDVSAFTRRNHEYGVMLGQPFSGLGAANGRRRGDELSIGSIGGFGGAAYEFAEVEMPTSKDESYFNRNRSEELAKSLENTPGEPFGDTPQLLSSEGKLKRDSADRMDESAGLDDVLVSNGTLSLLGANTFAGVASASKPIAGLKVLWDERDSDGMAGKLRPGGRRYYSRGQQQQLWIGTLLPILPQPAAEVNEPKSIWPAPALALSRSLLRAEKLAALAGGLVIERRTEGFAPGSDEPASRGQRFEFVSPTAWLGRTVPEGGPITITWCDSKDYGSINRTFQLGRVRASNAQDVKTLPLELADHSLAPLHRAFPGYEPKVEAMGDGRSLVLISTSSNPEYEIRVVIDTNRSVILSIEHRNKGKATQRTVFDDFTEAAGCWWARRVETFDEKDRRTSRSTQTITVLAAGEFKKAIEAELAAKATVVLMKQPLPALDAAKAAAAAGTASFDDHAALTVHFAASQQWMRAQEHLQACEKLTAGKPGMRWLKDAYLQASRRHEELRKRLLDEATEMAKVPDGNDYALAEHLHQQAQQVLQVNEQIELQQRLKPVYERQSPRLQAVKAWRMRQVGLLIQAGQVDRALPLSKQLATDHPQDRHLQHQHAQHLAQAGDYTAALAWLDETLKAKWTPYDEDSLRSLYARFLEQQSRHRQLAEFSAAWMARGLESDEPFGRHLAALVRSNQVEKAEAIASEWLKAGQVHGVLSPVARRRLDAAIPFALGHGHGLYSNRTPERWHTPLAEAARAFAVDDDRVAYASAILNAWRFEQTDAVRDVRRKLAAILKAEAATLSLAQLESFDLWTQSEAGLEVADWAKIAQTVRTRWDAEKDADKRARLAAVLLRLLNRINTLEALAFLRVQYEQAQESYQPTAASQLFDALLSRPWSRAMEDEAFTILDKMPSTEDAGARLTQRIAALHRLDDTMLSARFEALMKAVKHPETLTRTELQKVRAEYRRKSREDYAERLKQEASKHGGAFAQWLGIEQLWLEALIERDLPKVAAECWAILDTPAVKAVGEDALDRALRHRARAILTNLAARKGAEAALVERLVTFVRTQIATHADDPSWRSELYRLLIAIDRPQDLEAELRKWIDAAEPQSTWRLALADLLAEQGKVAEAVTLAEAVEKADELSPAGYRKLAEWRLALNRRAEHETAMAAVYKTMPEHDLSHRIYTYLHPWQNPGHLPTKFEPEVLRIYSVLFEKSTTPANYLDTLRQFYQSSREFRLLSMLADGVVGHTAAKVYPFILGMTGVLHEVGDEATADELLARLVVVRAAAKTPVDHRALDLLELLVERRAAELQNQPGPHIAKALIALKRAFQREWSAGEPRLMADFLAGLGAISAPELAREQLRQLEELHRTSLKDSFDRLHIAHHLAEVLHRKSDSARAMDVLTAALTEYEAANHGVLPVTANPALDTLIGITESMRQFARGEKMLLAQLQHPANLEQRYWLVKRHNQLCMEALHFDGEVSLGHGAALFTALEKKFAVDRAVPDALQVQNILMQSCRLYTLARERKLDEGAAALKRFAFETLPPILLEQDSHYEETVSQVAQTLVAAAGPRDALAFLVNCLENEPGWRRYTGEDGWSRHAFNIGMWRTRVNDLGDLEPRLLKLVLAELRRDLRTRESRNRSLYTRGDGHFWPEKAGDFAKAAEEVIADFPDSSLVLEHAAEYLFQNLGLCDRGVAVLADAHRRHVLSEQGQWQLIRFQHDTGKFAESVPLLQALVAKRPDNISSYRVRLMHAYHRSGRHAELMALLKETDERFRARGVTHWGEDTLAALAASCLENGLHQQSAVYYAELIPHHQRTHARRGIGNGTLSGYYSQAAQAYSGLGKTREAVDMAAGAVVSWAPQQSQRHDALNALVQVLAAAKDLPEYAASLDAEPLQSAVVRKAIGKAYIQKNDHARAVAQLRLAAELQPEDRETVDALVLCLDKVGDRDGAVSQLLEAAEINRRDLQLYKTLGDRYTAAKEPAEAERAYTSIVEAQPKEAESHARLAEVRQSQDRWSEALPHWRRVTELRALEPTGLLKLAAAQIHLKQFKDAEETLQKLHLQSWPPRFGDVPQQVRDLESRLKR